MRLLEVNGVSLLGASHQEAVNTLRHAGDVIRLLVCEGYDDAEVERLQSEGKLTRETKSTSESVSSLDRIGEDAPRSPLPLDGEASCDKEDPEPRRTSSLPVSPTLSERGLQTSEKV